MLAFSEIVAIDELECEAPVHRGSIRLKGRHWNLVGFLDPKHEGPDAHCTLRVAVWHEFARSFCHVIGRCAGDSSFPFISPSRAIIRIARLLSTVAVMSPLTLLSGDDNLLAQTDFDRALDLLINVDKDLTYRLLCGDRD